MAQAGGKADEPICSINVTPLVDVCLVLVIIFMAVAPFAVTLGLKVLSARAKAATGKAAIDQNVSVRLSADGRITVDGAAVAPEGLPLALSRALSRSRDKMVVLTAADDNRVGQVVSILDQAQLSGALKLAILKAGAAR
ncbi:MAG: biopolymer transporter ExbD [Elusimicrobia bacterium]|nr:biopolymer transporter ExbD [Elusimicrobiota bacterium]MDE2237977.1 biopolymer transporter ExbD [Elusimicrobiota bacterium]MDE2426057.1 biopolymer transporter ExbD [Elusimicrobiota bacterium]